MDSIALIGRLILALAVVLAVMWAIAKVAQKRGRGTARKGQVLTVLARQSVSRNSSIAVVKVMDRAMVVGITDGTVTLLGDTDLDAVEALADSGRSGARAGRDAEVTVLEAVEPNGADGFGATTFVRRAEPAITQSHRHHRSVRAVAPTGTPAGTPARTPARNGALAGSALSLGTWKQAVEAVREKTVRRA